MIDEKKLIETLESWKQIAAENQYTGLKEENLLEKVIWEVKRMADEANH